MCTNSLLKGPTLVLWWDPLTFTAVVNHIWSSEASVEIAIMPSIDSLTVFWNGARWRRCHTRAHTRAHTHTHTQTHTHTHTHRHTTYVLERLSYTTVIRIPSAPTGVCVRERVCMWEHACVCVCRCVRTCTGLICKWRTDWLFHPKSLAERASQKPAALAGRVRRSFSAPRPSPRYTCCLTQALTFPALEPPPPPPPPPTHLQGPQTETQRSAYNFQTAGIIKGPMLERNGFEWTSGNAVLQPRRPSWLICVQCFELFLVRCLFDLVRYTEHVP